MKEKVLKSVWLRVAMIVAVVTTAFAGTAWAQTEDIYKQALFGQGYNLEWIADYGNFAAHNPNYDNFEVIVSNAKNCGNRNKPATYYTYAMCNTNTVISTAGTIDSPVTKVVLTLGGTTSAVNSIKLFISSDCATWTPTDGYSFVEGENNEWTATIPAAAQRSNLYYEIVFANSSKDKVQVSKIDYYAILPDPTAPKAPAISATLTDAFVGGSSNNTESTVTISPAAGDTDVTLYYSTNGGTTWTQGTSLTLEEETTTVKAKATKDGKESPIASKSFILGTDVTTATWNLTTTPTGTHTTELLQWPKDQSGKSTEAVMTVVKGAGSNLPTSISGSTALTKGNILTVAPITGYSIVSVVFDMNSGQSTLGGTWNNATVSVSGKVVTVEAIDGTKPISINLPGQCAIKSANLKAARTSTYAYATIGTIVKSGSVGYGTMYYGNLDLKVPANVTAKTYKVTTKLEESKTYSAGEVIPAGEAVVLEGPISSEPYKFEIITKYDDPNSAPVLDPDNALKGVDEKILLSGYTYYYALMMKNGVPGFYWVNAGGAAFNCPAHKAYLPLNSTFAQLASGSGDVKGFISLDGEDDATGIEAIECAVENGAIYNVAGQRLQKMQKGINIVNGKKILK